MASDVAKTVLVYKSGPCHPCMGVAGLEIHSSSLEFLARALGGELGHLVVFTEWSDLRERSSYLELCTLLRSDPRTTDLPLGCIMHERHRGMLEGLRRAAVDWVFCETPNRPILPVLLAVPGPEGKAWQWLDDLVREMCPYLNYRSVRGDSEMRVCGAYRNRLVLGRGTLETLCHHARHTQCPHFPEPNPVGFQH